MNHNALAVKVAKDWGGCTPPALLTNLRRNRIMASVYIPLKKSRRNYPQYTRDMAGLRYGQVLVCEYVATKLGIPQWRCECDCGGQITVGTRRLLRGLTTKCGVLENHPRVYKKQDAEERFWRKVMPIPFSGCWIWMGACDSSGYGKMGFEGKTQTTTRVAWRLFRGGIPAGMNALHKCDVKSCVNPDHLYLGGHSENIIDTYNRGQRGVEGDHPNAKLSNSQRAEIRVSKETHRALAVRYGVHEGTIRYVRTHVRKSA